MRDTPEIADFLTEDLVEQNLTTTDPADVVSLRREFVAVARDNYEYTPAEVREQWPIALALVQAFELEQDDDDDNEDW